MQPNVRMQTLALGLSCAVAGCDAQLSPDYLGESLLTVTGNVEIAETSTSGRLVPALGFLNRDAGHLTIMDVAVRGEFPSDFRLDVYERPPADAFFDATYEHQGEPRMAFGYITAVPVMHPGTVDFSTEETVTLFSGCLDEACTKTCQSEGQECRVSETKSCDSKGACYTETLFCPTFSSPRDACRTETQGDPSVTADPFRYFAGFSQNYVVVYLDAAAPADSWTATLLGAPEGLAAGYGLFAVRALNADEAMTAEECAEQVNAVAAADYNRDHGTDYPNIEPDACLTCVGCAAPPYPWCQGFSSGEEDPFQKDYVNYHEQAKLEFGCALSGVVYSRVTDPVNESVSVRIGPENPPGF